MIIPVIWKSYKLNEGIINRGYWDQALIEAIFSRELWNPVGAYEFRHYDDFTSFELGGKTIKKEGNTVIEYKVEELSLISQGGAIVIIPARHHKDKIKEINDDIAKLKWVLIILCGDEEADFPCEELNHPNMKIWVQTPHIGKHKNADRFLVNGWAINTREHLKESNGIKPLDWFFAGQVTHSRRKECVKQLKEMEASNDPLLGSLIESPRFTEGLEPEEYCRQMAMAKVAPCPSGAVIPDTFRLYEALEAGVLPIADGRTPKLEMKNYWRFLFGEDVPFPVLDDWKDLIGTIHYFVDVFPLAQNKVFAWWQNFKREMVYNLEDDLDYLTKNKKEITMIDDKITVLIPTSPIVLHPDTIIIEETIKTIRERLPNSEIIIMFDGVRDEQKSRTADYAEYIRRMLWKCNFEYKNVLPIVFENHMHQVAMTREALKKVKTPLILFAEHDTPICEYIPFENMANAILDGDANMIRLHHEALILDEHKDLMLDNEPIINHDIPMTRTAQWSQRPHLASTSFYREILDKYFSPSAKCMIEDGIHGKLNEAYRLRGHVGWNDFKVWIYSPEGDMKRSYNLDARGSDPKYDETFIY